MRIFIQHTVYCFSLFRCTSSGHPRAAVFVNDQRLKEFVFARTFFVVASNKMRARAWISGFYLSVPIETINTQGSGFIYFILPITTVFMSCVTFSNQTVQGRQFPG